MKKEKVFILCFLLLSSGKLLLFFLPTKIREYILMWFFFISSESLLVYYVISMTSFCSDIPWFFSSSCCTLGWEPVYKKKKEKKSGYYFQCVFVASAVVCNLKVHDWIALWMTKGRENEEPIVNTMYVESCIESLTNLYIPWDFIKFILIWEFTRLSIIIIITTSITVLISRLSNFSLFWFSIHWIWQ